MDVPGTIHKLNDLAFVLKDQKRPLHEKTVTQAVQLIKALEHASLSIHNLDPAYRCATCKHLDFTNSDNKEYRLCQKLTNDLSGPAFVGTIGQASKKVRITPDETFLIKDSELFVCNQWEEA